MDYKKLLIVDDEPAIRDSLSAWLADSGYRITEAANGGEGIEACRREPPDIVLCDLRMPEMDGLQVLAHLTREFPELPVILVSGQGDMHDVIQALKLGAWDYVTKPIGDLEVLEHAMNQALERARLLRENREYQQHLEEANQKLRVALDRVCADEEAGRQIQFQLLPENHISYGPYQFSRQLFTSASLSGDFVDYFRIDANHVGFYLADVAGHGIPSALVTVILKNTLSRYLQDCWQGKDSPLLDPRDTVAKLNAQMLYASLGKHLAIFYGVLDLAENRLTYCSAGHYPFAAIFDGKSAVYEGRKHPPVGLFERVEYQSVTYSLPERFVMLLVSDGIMEILPQAHLAEKEAALLEVMDTLDINIEQLCDRLGIADAEAEMPDDISFLLVRR